MITKLFRQLLPAALIMTGIFFFSQTAAAHTAGKLQLSAAPAGPYQTSVWTTPDPAEIAELHVALSVVLAEDASPVLDADVMVEMTALDGRAVISAQATTEDSENKFLYEAILEPEEAGPYQVTININGSDGGAGAVSFELEVVDDSGFNPLYLIPIGLAVAAVVLLIFSRYIRPGPTEESH